MKRLLFLMTVAMFAMSTTGCYWWRPWHRGSQCEPYAQGGGGYMPESGYAPMSGSAPILRGPVEPLPPG